MELRERIALKITVDCGEDSEFPCPYAAKCPHEDKDVCLWQLEQADEIIAVMRK